MSELDDKFLAATEEIKECFVVAQVIAKNSFKIGLQRDALLEACKEASKRRHDGACQGNCLGGKCDCWLKVVNDAIAEAV